jgi:cytochrome P450
MDPRQQRVADPQGLVFVSPEAFSDMDAWFAAIESVRTTSPAIWVEPEGWEPFWVVTGHADVTEISRRSDVFWNTPHSAPSPNFQYELLEALGIEEPSTLVHLHGSQHKQTRDVTNEWFKPAAVKGLQPAIEEIAEEYAHHLREFEGTCDFAMDIAVPYTIRVIMSIFGIPKEDEALMLELTQGLFGAADPEYMGDFSDPAQLVASTLGKFTEYFDEVTKDRRAHPTGDLATVIANGTIEGDYLPDAVRFWYYVIVATAGHDTTSYGLSGTLDLLLANPDQFALLRREPTLVNNAVEEALRMVSPVRSFLRWAQEDVELASGIAFVKGDAVLTSYPAANRDPAVFEAPNTFNIERANADRLLTFGMGVHHCLGAQVARREIRTMLSKLLEQTESIERAGEPQWARSHFVSGVKHLPIAYTLT